MKQLSGSRTLLDHSPVILDTNPVSWGPCPFRFENMWLEHPRFKESCKEKWEYVSVEGWEGCKFSENVRSMIVSVKEWNKEVFGDVRLIKSELSTKIDFLDRREEGKGLNEERSERKVLRNLGGIFKELIMWRQKMRLRWVKEGDANSKLFHNVVNNRRNKSSISRLEKENGEVVQNIEDVLKELIEYYEKL